MRTREHFDFAYNGLSPKEFGKRTSQSAGQVRAMIAEGWFDWTEDGKPGCIDIANPGAKMPTYKINPAAVERYLKERSARRVYPKRKKAS